MSFLARWNRLSESFNREEITAEEFIHRATELLDEANGKVQSMPTPEIPAVKAEASK